MLTPEGAESLHADEIEVLGNFITAQVVGGAYAAMDEMGTGSLLDKSNPALPEYMKSEMWNPYRGKHGSDDTAIRTRVPGGIDIFGNPVKGSKNPGINLEAAGKVTPQVPSHALQTAAKWMCVGRIQKIWQQSLSSFPWGKFIITTKD